MLPPAYVVRREGTLFTGVCLSTPGGGGGLPHLHPIILQLVPCPFWGCPHDWSQVPSWVSTLARSGWGVPQPGPDGDYPGQGWVSPGQVRMGGTPARSRWGKGYPLPRDGVPPLRDGIPPSQGRGTPLGQVRKGYPCPGMGCPQWGMGYPPARDGVPLQDRTADGILDTQQTVCLLHSRRRTFLFCFFIFTK